MLWHFTFWGLFYLFIYFWFYVRFAAQSFQAHVLSSDEIHNVFFFYFILFYWNEFSRFNFKVFKSMPKGLNKEWRVRGGGWLADYTFNKWSIVVLWDRMPEPNGLPGGLRFGLCPGYDDILAVFVQRPSSHIKLSIPLPVLTPFTPLCPLYPFRNCERVANKTSQLLTCSD